MDATAHAIAAYWALLADAAVRCVRRAGGGRAHRRHGARRLAPAQAAFDQAQVAAFSAMAQAGQGPRFQASRDLARFLLEGLARGNLAYERDGRVQNLMTVVDRAVRMLNRKGDVQELWAE